MADPQRSPGTDELLEQLLQHTLVVASRLDHIPVPAGDTFTRGEVRKVAQSMRDIVSALRAAADGIEDDVARCGVCGCTENEACDGGCHWVPDPQMDDLCSRCDGAVLRITVDDLRNGGRAVRGVPAGNYAMVATDPCTYTVQPLQEGVHRITVRGRTEARNGG
jgi:hypothetical protein